MTTIKYSEISHPFGLKWWFISEDQIQPVVEFTEPTKSLTILGISNYELKILRKWLKANRDCVSEGHIQEFEDSDIEDRVNNELNIKMVESKYDELCQLLTELPVRDQAAKVYFENYEAGQEDMKKYSEEYNIKFFGGYENDRNNAAHLLDDYYIVSANKEDLFALFLHWEHEFEMLSTT